MSWHEIQLGDAIHVKHGFAFKGEFFASSGEYMVLTPGNFFEAGGFRVRDGKERFYTADIPEPYILSPDDLIVAMTEQGEGLLGSAARVPSDGKYLHNQRLGLIDESNPEIIDQRFLYWLFNTPSVRAQIRATATGAKVKHTAPERIYKVKTSVPDVAAQAAIAFVLDSYDNLIAANQRRIQLLEESARLLYREWFVKLRFPGHETVAVVDGVPVGWEKKTLGGFVTLNYGKGLKETDRIDGDTPVYGSSGIVGYHNKPLITGPAIIVGRKGNVGSVYYSHCPCFPIDTVYFVSSVQTSYFLYLTLQGMNFISSDAAVPGLNRNYAYSLQLIVPVSNVFSLFETKVQPIFEQINSLVILNIKLRQARDLLLPKLMSGALDVSSITVPKEIEA